MPNNCHNDLYISGPKDQVDALLAHIGANGDEPAFNFTSVVPYPAEFAAKDADMRELGWEGFSEKYGPDAKDGFNSGGYEWCSENWGTKWSAYEVQRRDYEGFCLTFQTAWCPPSPVIIALHKLFPMCSLYLESFERGMEFCGGFSLLSAQDYYGDEPWEAGIKSNEWSGKYSGQRGG